MYKEAKKALNFIFKCQLSTGAFPQRIDQKGNDASYKPIQIDGTGLAAYAFCYYIEKTQELSFAEKHWQKLKDAVSYILSNIYEDKSLVYTPNSIHEFPPTEAGLEIWANSVCCSALSKAHSLGQLLGHEHKEWLEAAKAIKNAILEHMWNSRVGCFVKNIRIKESSSVLVDVDASAYAVADFGVIEDSYSKVKATVKAIEKKLWNKQLGGICRYPKYEGRNNGGWGPWPHFTLMLCRHFIRVKNKKKAERYLAWVVNAAHKSFLPEHIATVKEFEEYVSDFTEAGLLRKDRMIMIENARKNPLFKKGVAYITTPLAWPHAEFIRTWKLYKAYFG